MTSRSGVRAPKPAGLCKSDFMAYYDPREVKRRRAKAHPAPPSTRQVVMGVPKKTWMMQGPALDPYLLRCPGSRPIRPCVRVPVIFSNIRRHFEQHFSTFDNIFDNILVQHSTTF